MSNNLTGLLAKNMVDLHDAIEDCYDKGRYMPCLVLLYSGIDVAASLEPSSGTGVGERFTKWVERYMLENAPLNCTAVDLYAARCAVVHTYTPESDLSRTGKARLIAYAFGPAQLEKLEEASALAHQNRQVNVHARQLIDAFYKGIKAYLDEVETDTSRLQEIERSASQWTVNMDPKTMDKYLEGKKLLKTQTEDPSPH